MAAHDETRLDRRQFLRYGATVAAGAAALPLAARSGLLEPAALARPGSALRPALRASSLNVGLATTTPNLDPLQGDDDTYAYAVFDALTYIFPGTHAVKPRLATSWKQVSDTVTVFKLDPRAKFSDGSPVTASDVAFSFNTVMEKGYLISSIIPTIKSVTAVDPHTVKITTVAPDPILAKRVALIFVVPQAYYTSAGSNFGNKPIGSGYYTVQSFTPNTSITFVASPNSWKGQPATHQINLTEYSQQSALLSAIQSGQLDVAQDLPGEALDVLKGSYDLYKSDIGSPLMVVLDTLKAPFKDPRVRLAANLAVDVPTIVNKINNGAGIPLQGQLLGRGCFGYDPSLKSLGYDPRKARQLLAAAGYKHGFDTQIAGLAIDQPILEAVAGYLRAVGIRASVLPLAFDVWVGGFINGSTWPMFLNGINYSPLYDAVLTYRYVTGSSIPKFHKNFVNHKFDKLMAEQASEMSSSKRLALLQQAAQVIHSELPVVFLYDQEWIYGWNKSVVGVEASSGYHVILSNMFKPAS